MTKLPRIDSIDKCFFSTRLTNPALAARWNVVGQGRISSKPTAQIIISFCGTVEPVKSWKIQITPTDYDFIKTTYRVFIKSHRDNRRLLINPLQFGFYLLLIRQRSGLKFIKSQKRETSATKTHYYVHWNDATNTRSWEAAENITQAAMDAFENGIKSRQRETRKLAATMCFCTLCTCTILYYHFYVWLVLFYVCAHMLRIGGMPCAFFCCCRALDSLLECFTWLSGHQAFHLIVSDTSWKHFYIVDTTPSTISTTSAR